jgi:hypothetical protein
MNDKIDFSTVHIHNSHDVREWPATATITRLEFRPSGVHVEHTRQHGPQSWPDFTPPGWDGPLQYTLWIFLRIRDEWHASGCIQYWRTCEENGGPPEEFAKNWYYAEDRWAPMTGHQPAPGELVGFMVTAGDARNNGTVSVQERSDLVMMPFPAGGAVYVPLDTPPRPDTPDPPDHVTPDTPGPDRQALQGSLDDLRQQILELTRRVDELLSRQAPVYRGAIPGLPALGIKPGTLVLEPDRDPPK